MRQRARIESYWSVWIFNSARPDTTGWEPYDEGMSKKSAALKEMRAAEKRNPDERFCVVRTVHARLETTPQRGETKGDR